MKLFEIKGFSKYALDTTSRRVYSKSGKHFMTPLPSGGYSLIRDGAPYRYGKRVRTTMFYPTLMGSTDARNSFEIGGSTAPAKVADTTQLFIVAKVVGTTVFNVTTRTNLSAAKAAAEGLAKNNPGFNYGVFPLTVTCVAGGVFWK